MLFRSAALSRDPAVTFTGRVDDVRTLIGGSAVSVVPLRKGGGTRLKILESMALGTPVVSTSKGAEGLLVTPERDILIADTPDEFCGHVIRLLDDRTLRSRLAANGRGLVSDRYTWDRIGAQFDDLLAEACASSSRHVAVRSEGEASRAVGA